MKAFILAAGKGIRLLPLTKNKPKVMLPIGEKPILEHLILLCKRHDINEFIINLFWKPKVIINYFRTGKKLDVKIYYSEEKELMGTAGALKLAEKQITDTFLVLYGDVMMNIDLSKLIKYHKEKYALVTIVIHKTSHPKDSDLVIADKNGRVKKFINKDSLGKKNSLFSNAGLFIAEPELLKYIKKGKSLSFEKDIIQDLLKRDLLVFAYKTNEYLEDIGTKKRYSLALNEFKKNY